MKLCVQAVTLAALASALVYAQSQTYPFQDPKLAVEQRVS